MIRDHFRGTNTFDLDTKENTAYAKITPYRYVNLEETVAEPYLSKILELESKFGDPKNSITGLKEYTTPDFQEHYGYQLMFKNVPYVGVEVFDGLFGEEPDQLKTLREQGVEIFYHSCYLDKDANFKYLGVTMRLSGLNYVPGFSELENFDDIRNTVINETGGFQVLYWYDVTDNTNISMYFFDRLPESLGAADVLYNRDESFYVSKKESFYQSFLNSNLISSEDYQFIIDNSPRMQQSTIKYLWKSGSIIARELETTCVFDFEDV